MLKKIKITDPVTGISAIFSGVVYGDCENKMAQAVYSEENAKSRLAEDIVHAKHLLAGNGRYIQTAIWDDEPATYNWEYSPDYRTLRCYDEIEEIETRLIVEQLD